MKITTGQFSDSYFPIMDGVGMTAHNYARWLNEKYGSSCIIAPKVKEYKDKVSYPVYRFKSVLVPGMNPYRIGLPLIDVRFKKEIRNIGFDLVHAHCPFISGNVASSLAKRLDIPLVATFHTKYREDFKKVINNEVLIDFMLNMTLDFYKSADFVWVPNKATGHTLTEYGFKGSYEVMPNGCDINIPGKSRLAGYRKKGRDMIKTGTDEFVMLFVGQHRWEKNIRLIIDAMKQLKQAGESFKMIFVGEGYAADEMKELVKKYEIQDYVKFLGVITDRKILERVYAAADLFVFPSIYDNSPLVIQEAAAFKIPSVLVKNSSAAEKIHDGVNGFLVENESEDLAREIKELMSHKDKISNAGKEACKSIYQPWEAIVDEVNLRYKDIIKDHRSALLK